jgi:hypothetical protein
VAGKLRAWQLSYRQSAAHNRFSQASVLYEYSCEEELGLLTKKSGLTIET